jgi:outer membrane protein OmpA-like peptidoglycan-associated protein
VTVAAIGPLAVFYPGDAIDGAPDEALMDRDGMASSLPRLLVTRTTSFAIALIFLAVGASLATAQTVIGERSQPSVTVDTSVLDSLGPPPTLPDLLRGKPTPQQTTVTAGRPRPAKTAGMHVPKKRVAEARLHKPKPEVAAKRAAPVVPVATSGAAAVPREPVAVAPLAEPAAPAPAPTPPSDAPAKEPAPTPTAMAVAPKAPDVAAVAAPAEPTPAAKPAVPPPPALVPTTMAPTSVPPATPPRQLPTATASPDARAVMSTSPAVAPPPSAPAIVPPPTQTQTAALTPVAAAAGSTRVLFSAGGAELPDAARGELDAVARQLSSNDHARLQLVGYAGGGADEANQARRISLQRALAVRSYLMEHGVPNTRMDVRALGNRADVKDPPDRVDIVMLDR